MAKLDIEPNTLLDYLLSSVIRCQPGATKPKQCLFKSYATNKFAQILKNDKLTFDDIEQSFCTSDKKRLKLSAGNGGGRSGSLFFFSSDSRFLIKTLQGYELNQILQNVDKFIQHFKSTKNASLIARIYGVFSFTIPNAPPMNFVIMQNVAMVKNTEERFYEFDLKGSSIDRYVSQESSASLKDLDQVFRDQLIPDDYFINHERSAKYTYDIENIR